MTREKIETVEELRSLPVLSVIRSDDHELLEKWGSEVHANGVWYGVVGDVGGWKDEDILLPATLLDRPDTPDGIPKPYDTSAQPKPNLGAIIQQLQELEREIGRML